MQTDGGGVAKVGGAVVVVVAQVRVHTLLAGGIASGFLALIGISNTIADVGTLSGGDVTRISGTSDVVVAHDRVGDDGAARGGCVDCAWHAHSRGTDGGIGAQ